MNTAVQKRKKKKKTAEGGFGAAGALTDFPKCTGLWLLTGRWGALVVVWKAAGEGQDPPSERRFL